MKLFCTILFISFYALTMAQTATSNVKYDVRLLELYDKSYLENLQENNAFVIERWNYLLDNAYKIIDFPEEKMSDNYPVIQIDNPDNINILLLMRNLDLSAEREKNTFYRIGSTNKHLLLYATKDLMDNLNRKLGRSYDTE